METKMRNHTSAVVTIEKRLTRRKTDERQYFYSIKGRNGSPHQPPKKIILTDYRRLNGSSVNECKYKLNHEMATFLLLLFCQFQVSLDQSLIQTQNTNQQWPN